MVDNNKTTGDDQQPEGNAFTGCAIVMLKLLAVFAGIIFLLFLAFFVSCLL